jgi:hypothetical protein
MQRLFIVLVLITLVVAAAAQDAVLERQRTDATVRIELGASGKTVPAERVMIREVGAVMSTLAEASNVDGEVTFEDLKVFNFKPHIVSAWVEGVAYHTKVNGQVFLDGQPAVVHAFEQTDDLTGLSITGMNVVVRHREGGYEMEFIATVDNQSRPQRTIRASALPVRLALPPALRSIEVEVDNGPDPLTGTLRSAGGGMQGVATALTPGEARITVRGDLRTEGSVDFTVASNLPVAKWSLLAWPASLEVRSFDLERDRSNAYPEFSRWLGKPLEPGDEVDVTVNMPAAAAAEPVFAESAPDETETTDQPEPEGRGFPWITVIVAVLLFGGYFVWRARR